MDAIKSGLPKDAVWLLMVVLAFGAGWALHRSETAAAPVSQSPPSATLRQPVSALSGGGIDRVSQPARREMDSSATPAPAIDPVVAELQQRTKSLTFVEDLAQLAKIDPTTAPDAAHYISSEMDLGNLPKEYVLDIFQNYMSTEPEAAQAWWSSLPADTSGNMSAGMVSFVHDWTLADPKSARTWLRSQESAENYEHLATAFAIVAARSKPEAAANVAETMPTGKLRDNIERLLAGGVVMSHSRSDQHVSIRVE